MTPVTRFVANATPPESKLIGSVLIAGDKEFFIEPAKLAKLSKIESSSSVAFGTATSIGLETPTVELVVPDNPVSTFFLEGSSPIEGIADSLASV